MPVAYFRYFFGGGIDCKRCEIVNFHEAEHVIEFIKYKDGVVATGKFAEGRFLGNAVH